MAKDNRNIEVTDKVFTMLNDVKGFEMAMGDPSTGKILTRYNGENFVLTLEPAYHAEDSDKAPKNMRDFLQDMRCILS